MDPNQTTQQPISTDFRNTFTDSFNASQGQPANNQPATPTSYQPGPMAPMQPNVPAPLEQIPPPAPVQQNQPTSHQQPTWQPAIPQQNQQPVPQTQPLLQPQTLAPVPQVQYHHYNLPAPLTAPIPAPNQQPTGQPVQQPVQAPVQTPVQPTAWPTTPTTVAAPPPSPFTPAPTPSPTTTTSPMLQQIGIDASQYQTPDQLIQALASQVQQQQVALQVAQTQPPQQQTPNPATTQQPEEWTIENHFAKQWEVPAFDPQWNSMIRNGAIVQDANGNYVPADASHAWLTPQIQALNAYEVAREQKARSLFEGNFYKNVWDGLRDPIEHEIDARVSKAIESHQTQQRNEQYMSDFNAKYAGQLFTVAPGLNGLPQRVPTQLGQQFFDYADQLAQAGVASPADQIRMAMDRFGGAIAQPQQPNQQLPNQPPQPTVQQPAVDYFGVPTTQTAPQTVTSQVNTSAWQQQPAQPSQPNQQSFLDQAFNTTAYQPTGNGNPGPQPDHNQPMTDDQIRNIFVDDFNRRNGSAAPTF